MEWGGHMKVFVLLCIFLNVLVSPWGLAQGGAIGELLLAVPLVLVKILAFVLILVVIESSLAKLRLFRIPEFLGAAFVTSVAAVITRLLEM
jgi:formate hydrogenlyase subunit 4